VEFEWDEEKAEQNSTKHGVDFRDAVHVFLDPFRIERHDECVEYGEDRFQTIGMVEGRVLLVVYTDRGEAYRIISARRATRREKTEYEDAFGS
jgi:uncharacterized protein